MADQFCSKNVNSEQWRNDIIKYEFRKLQQKLNLRIYTFIELFKLNNAGDVFIGLDNVKNRTGRIYFKRNFGS